MMNVSSVFGRKWIAFISQDGSRSNLRKLACRVATGEKVTLRELMPLVKLKARYALRPNIDRAQEEAILVKKLKKILA